MYEEEIERLEGRMAKLEGFFANALLTIARAPSSVDARIAAGAAYNEWLGLDDPEPELRLVR